VGVENFATLQGDDNKSSRKKNVDGHIIIITNKAKCYGKQQW